jgi:hypothetical protein
MGTMMRKKLNEVQLMCLECLKNRDAVDSLLRLSVVQYCKDKEVG